MPDPSAAPQAQSPHDEGPTRKPRRFWLFAPYVALLVAVLAWSAVWQVEKWRLSRALTKEVAELQKQGYTAQWSSLKIDGYPFRLRVTLIGPRWGDNAGWGLSATKIEAQAYAYAPSQWILAAPEGLIVTRPGEGALTVSGKAIRASIGGLGSAQPRFSFEGDALALTPAPGAAPPPFSAVGKIEAHLQPGPNDQAALLLRIDDAQLRPETGLAKLAAGKPFDLLWDSRLTRLSAFRGSNWPGALQAWRNAGGLLTVTDAKLGLAGVTFDGQGGPITVDTDGRLKGELPMKLQGGEGAAKALLQAIGLLGPVPLRFQDGRATIGSTPIGQALKIG
jgi:hypothetical protein